MRDDTLKRGLEALAAIGALRRDPPRPYSFDFETRHTDAHWRKVMVAWRQIASHEYLPGAMQWAAKHHADRYHDVTSELPAEWERLWDEDAPLIEFQAALDNWVRAHEELIGRYPVTQGTK